MNADPVGLHDAKPARPDEIRRQNVENASLSVGGRRSTESEKNEPARRDERRLAVEIAEVFVERQQNETFSPSDFKDFSIGVAAVTLRRGNDAPPKVAQGSDGSAGKILVG